MWEETQLSKLPTNLPSTSNQSQDRDGFRRSPQKHNDQCCFQAMMEGRAATLTKTLSPVKNLVDMVLSLLLLFF